MTRNPVGSWHPFPKTTPPKPGRYLVYAPSCDAKIPFFTIAWWEPPGWEFLLKVWADAITHWARVKKPKV